MASRRRLWPAGAGWLCLLIAAACDDGTTSPGVAPSPTRPSVLVDLQIEVPGGSSAAAVGETIQLEARAIYADGSTALVTRDTAWASLAPEIATVTTAGRVTFVAGGSATIRATYLAASAERILQVRGRAATVTARIDSIEAVADCDGVLSGRGEFIFFVTVTTPLAFDWEYRWRDVALGTSETFRLDQSYSWEGVEEEPGAFVEVTFEATEYDSGAPDPRMNARSATARFTWTASGGWSPTPGRARQITLGSGGCEVRLSYRIDVSYG